MLFQIGNCHVTKTHNLPSIDSSDLSDESLEQSEESSYPSDESSDPSDESLDQSEESSDPSDESADPSDESSDQSENSLSEIVNICNYINLRQLQLFVKMV